MAQTLLPLGPMNMQDKTCDRPSVRLAAAGCLSLLVLLWVGVFDDSWQTVFIRVSPCHFREPFGNLVTVALSLSALTALYPVVRLRRSAHRWSAAFLAAFP